MTLWQKIKIIQKYFEGVFGYPLFYYFCCFGWPPKHFQKMFCGFFLSFYDFVWTLSFTVLLYFLFYKDCKGFIDTFKFIHSLFFFKRILHSKICTNIGRFLKVFQDLILWFLYKNKVKKIFLFYFKMFGQK